jgi:hypothetical protein
MILKLNLPKLLPIPLNSSSPKSIGPYFGKPMDARPLII